jgi:hypothetical protein
MCGAVVRIGHGEQRGCALPLLIIVPTQGFRFNQGRKDISLKEFKHGAAFSGKIGRTVEIKIPRELTRESEEFGHPSI